MNPHEGKIALALNLANLLAVTTKLQGSASNLLVGLAPGPFKSISPCGIAQPVADEVSITSIDQYWNLVQDVWNETVERLHPVPSEKEVPIHVKVAPIIAVNLHSKSLHDLWLVQIIVDPPKLGVAQTSILARFTHIVWILTGSLIRTEDGVIAVDGCRNTRPNAPAIVAALDKRLAARQSIVHGLASALVDNGWPAAIPTCHGSVMFVLGKAVGETVTNHDGFQINIGLLMPLYLTCKHGYIVTSV